MNLLEKRRVVRRLERFEAQLKLQPRDPQLWLRHAEAAFAAEQPVRALASYRVAASLFRGMGSWARAEAVLKRALELDPNERSLRQELEEVSAHRRDTPRGVAAAKALVAPAASPAPAAARLPQPLGESSTAKTELLLLTEVLLEARPLEIEDEQTAEVELEGLAAADEDGSGGFSLEASLPDGFDGVEVPEVLTSELILPAAEPEPVLHRARRLINVRRKAS